MKTLTVKGDYYATVTYTPPTVRLQAQYRRHDSDEWIDHGDPVWVAPNDYVGVDVGGLANGTAYFVRTVKVE